LETLTLPTRFGDTAGTFTADSLSRRTVRGGLSLRKPRNTAWRTLPSGVQPENRTSATSEGRTQRSRPRVSRDQRPGCTLPGSNGDSRVSSFSSLRRRSAAVVAFQPVPTLPA
jgi:hypothetical protein